jgi:osmotically inducible protein OsmC
MAIRSAEAIWEGTLQKGNGSMKFGSFEGAYSFSSRFEEGPGTNPEELLGAAHAGCYSMALSASLGKAGFTPGRIATHARVHLGKVNEQARITKIELETEAEVPGISLEQFKEIAETVKTGCPVSVALSAVEITLSASLI